MRKYVFLTPGQKVYIAEAPTQREALMKLEEHLKKDDLLIIATYLVTEEITS